MRRYEEEAIPVAGREFLLWIVVAFDRILRMKSWPGPDVIAPLIEEAARTSTDDDQLKQFFAAVSEFARKPLK